MVRLAKLALVLLVPLLLMLYFIYRLRRIFSKRSNNWTCYVQKEPKRYEYVDDMITSMLRHYAECDEKLTEQTELTPQDPRKLKRLLTDVSPPPTKTLFVRKKSRFGDVEMKEDK